jgi:hypothetical protein
MSIISYVAQWIKISCLSQPRVISLMKGMTRQGALIMIKACSITTNLAQMVRQLLFTSVLRYLLAFPDPLNEPNDEESESESHCSGMAMLDVTFAVLTPI